LISTLSRRGGDEDVLIVGREAMKILLDIALSMITKGFKDKNNIFFTWIKIEEYC
jgi:hypothetical protein